MTLVETSILVSSFELGLVVVELGLVVSDRTRARVSSITLGLIQSSVELFLVNAQGTPEFKTPEGCE